VDNSTITHGRLLQALAALQERSRATERAGSQSLA
jgi:hypothetical protein